MTAKSKASKAQPARVPFKQMTSNQKTVFVFQAVVCVVSLGFIFPNIFG